MSQASLVKHKQSLDALQSMINAVLIETGRALRSANRKGPKTIGYTHDRLQEFLPGAIDKFHFALDELESDIVRAKAVLGRDLREIQARRKQLEHPKAEQANDEMLGRDLAQPVKMSTPLVPDHSPSQQTAGMVKVTEIENFKMEDAVLPNKRSPEAKLDMLSLPSPPTSKIQGQIKPQEPSEQSIQQPSVTKNQGIDINIKISPDFNTSKIAYGPGFMTSNSALLQDLEAPVNVELHESSFNPLFEMANNSGSDNNVDNFGSTVDNATGQNEDFGIDAGEFDLSSFGNQTKNTDDNPNAMLQGPDNFGNRGDSNDLGMLDISDAVTNNQGMDQNAGNDFSIGGDLEFAFSMGANDSSFDDLLNGIDFSNTDNTTAGEMMDHGEFDDALFSTQ